MEVNRNVNGAAMAAMLGGAVGAFAMGAFVLLHEAVFYSAPAMYEPAGALSGRTTLAVIVWLVAWTVLRYRWKDRDVAPLQVAGATLLLVAGGVIATFPPVWSLVSPSAEAASARARQTPAIPPSLEAEHHEIHELLMKATAVPGGIGAAARELEAVLGPHFTRENQIALPPLGLLAPLAAGQKPVGTDEVLAMTDALRKELPGMLEEHTRIRAATEKLHKVAVQQNASEIQRFAEALAAHALMEEEVLYPAAILVGDVIRARR